MQHIAVFCKTLLKGGSEKQALILSKLLSGENKKVSLINWSEGKVDPEYLEFIKINSLSYFALNGNVLKKYIRLVKILREERVSIILSYLTLPNFIAGISKIFLREIVTIGGIRNEKLPYHKFLFERWTHNNLNNASIFNNYSAKNKFTKRGFKSNKIFVIHNAIESNHLIVSPGKARSDVRIVTVSRFVEQKDFTTALKSFKKLIDRNNSVAISYYIVGYGPMEQEINTLADDLNIMDRIKFFINPSNIPEILKDCDIYLSTSLFEGLSNSIMEAMVAGLPIVATDVGDNRYLIKEGYNGYLVPCKDINKIAEKLAILTESEELRRKYGDFSKSRIRDKFSNGNLLENYLKVFSEFQKS